MSADLHALPSPSLSAMSDDELMDEAEHARDHLAQLCEEMRSRIEHSKQRHLQLVGGTR